MKIIKGKTLEAQLKSIDVALTRIQRRARGGDAYSVIPPIPVFSYAASADQPVIRYLFPSKGIIKSALMHIDEMPKDGIKIKAELVTDTGALSRIAKSKKGTVKVELNFEVEVGDMVTISISPVNHEEEISGIWTSFLWAVDVKSSIVSRYILEQIEEEYNNAEENGEGTEAPSTEEGP